MTPSMEYEMFIGAEDITDEEPGAVDLIAILIGQADGQVEITDEQLRIARRCRIVRWQNHDRCTWTFALRPVDD